MCSRFTLHKNYNEQLLLEIKNVPIYGLIQPKLKKVSKNEWKPLEKTACIFLKFIEVHLWPDFTASNQHIWVYWGFPDRLTHIIRVGFYPFYIQLIHFGAWILLFLAVWAAQGSMDKNWVYFSYFWGWFFKLFRGKKILFFKNIVNSICTEKLINIKVRKV